MTKEAMPVPMDTEALWQHIQDTSTLSQEATYSLNMLSMLIENPFAGTREKRAIMTRLCVAVITRLIEGRCGAE